MIPRHLIIGVAVLVVTALGMSFYVWRMRRHVDQSAAGITSTQPVAPPVSGPTEEATLYIARDDQGTLNPSPTRIPLPADRQERAGQLLRALLNIYLDRLSPHVLPAGSEVREVYLVDPGLAVIDLNGAFSDGHRSGVLVEELTVASLVETLVANIPGVTRVKILVEGKERETLAGHADLTTSYDAAAVTRLAAQLQSSQ